MLPGSAELCAVTSATSNEFNSVPPSHEAAENKAKVRTKLRRESACCAFASRVGSTVLRLQLCEWAHGCADSGAIIINCKKATSEVPNNRVPCQNSNHLTASGLWANFALSSTRDGKPVWRNGRRDGLKIRSPQGGGGSSPSTGTTLSFEFFRNVRFQLIEPDIRF